MQEIVTFLNSIIWSPVLIYLCLGTGLFFSVLTRFVQIRLFTEMFRLLLSGKSSEQGISSFQALAVSLSGRVGTGNIAGVAAAIGFGGPGAVFWMWVVAFLGSSTAYIESTLAQIYKEETDGQYRGGPAYYIEKAMGQKWYAWIFAIATIIATGLLLPMVQSNGIGEAVVQVFGQGSTIETAMGTISLMKVYVATGIVLLLGFIIFGGVKRIANFTQVVVPFMALAYIIVSLVIIVLNVDRVPEIFMLIVGDAFSPMAGVGAAIGWGVKRGVYSNEAGQGTGPHAAAAAEVEHPAQQGLVQAFSVYIDTIFVCSATAFMILITGMYNVHVPGAEDTFIVQNIAADIAANSPAYTQIAVDSVFSGVGKPFIALALFFFAFTTILAYYFIAENNVYYIKRTLKFPGLTFALKVMIMLATFYGTVKAADLAWAMGDIGVGMMAWLNIIGILIIFFMAKPAIKALKDYEMQRKQGVDKYTFDPKALGIKKADFWEQRIQNNKVDK
ncbi:alanine/glycine:cation symporter family protein [Pseudoalteromonas denitrificans]|uniref:Alanine or glycine:cation symporter, AGCS family n=1 Tax=Pseudoalteromonas denitrificans DSM 6059 TaxID=1123010 RepID=A0A1I1P0M0_9GAMM|nr:alanine/glycine:cation symporter family protein [Pseudoalteromonas denitrificans]SFD01268.1 alanine or glycine:cation symporter, AGCS family [Pseudoalteromonas denitrificans DSM 6059]